MRPCYLISYRNECWVVGISLAAGLGVAGPGSPGFSHAYPESLVSDSVGLGHSGHHIAGSLLLHNLNPNRVTRETVENRDS
jgi:hypothetical protein